MWLDRYEPEPRSLLVLGPRLGCVRRDVRRAGPAALRHPHLRAPPTSSMATVVAPVTEEAAKGLFILLLLFYRRNELDGVLDGLVYAGMVGIGFAFTENILYLPRRTWARTARPVGSAARSACSSSAASSPRSPTRSSPRSSASASASPWRARRRDVRVLAPLIGYVVAVGAHAAWNGSLLLDDGRNAVDHLLLPDGARVPAAERVRGLVAPSRGRGAHRRAQRLRAARLPRPGRDPVAGPDPGPPLRPAVRRAGRRPARPPRDGGLPERGRRARLPAQPLPARRASSRLRS